MTVSFGLVYSTVIYTRNGCDQSGMPPDRPAPKEIVLHRGYLKLWRKVEDSGLLQIPDTYALFTFLLLKATHKPRKIGTPHGIVDLDRGQYISGRIALANDLKQSERQIRTGLDRLEKMGIVTLTATSRYSIYTIVKYNEYQSDDQEATSTTTNERPTDDQQTTNRRPTDDQQTTTKQELKEFKNEKNEKNNSYARGTRLPKEWVLPKSWEEWSLQEKPFWSTDDVRKCAEKFKDYWISVSGSKGVKLDWEATWRNWVRSSVNEVKQFRKDQGRDIEAEKQAFINGDNGNVIEGECKHA